MSLFSQQRNPETGSEEICRTEAEVAAKEGVYDEIPPEINPDGDPLFRVAFRTNDGVKIFWITSEEYYALKVGMRGLLVYSGKNLISFGNWIHPFTIKE